MGFYFYYQDFFSERYIFGIQSAIGNEHAPLRQCLGVLARTSPSFGFSLDTCCNSDVICLPHGRTDVLECLGTRAEEYRNESAAGSSQ
jgi:hypothetical protein